MSGCMTAAPSTPVVVQETLPTPNATAKRIARDGAGGFILPDGTRVAGDQDGGFGPIGASDVVVRLRHLPTVLGFKP